MKSEEIKAVENEETLLKAIEVAFLVGVSMQTLSSWYRWKQLNPDHERAQLLPDYIRKGNKNTRYWKQSDMWKLLEFKSTIQQGRYGLMGDVTQKYCKTNYRNKEKYANE